jgi:hypothetical protein
MKPNLTNDTRLLSLSVYRTRYESLDNGAESDCTNGGVSAKACSLYIPHPQGPFRVADVDARLIFIPEHRGGSYWALKPYVGQRDGRAIGPMDGGNLATSCDSRAEGRVYHIHDRYETAEEYAALSR